MKKNISLFWMSSILILLLTSVSSAADPELIPVEKMKFDINQYMGDWYDIAHTENSFQDGCSNTKATYKKLDETHFEFTNICDRKGKPDKTVSIATFHDSKIQSQLKVRVFLLFHLDYWILAVDEKYQVALIGQSDKDKFWIVSRKPTISESLYQKILDDLKLRGYKLDKIVKTVHSLAN